MNTTVYSIILLGAVILTGLSAGFFYAWLVSVIPGTKKVMDLTYLETMQKINRAILNPAFYIIFFGSIILLILASIYQIHNNRLAFILLLASTLTYLIGTLGVTGLGNVPLNYRLELLDISESSTQNISEFRKFYEVNWNKLHLIRTLFALLSFILAIVALYIHIK